MGRWRASLVRSLSGERSLSSSRFSGLMSQCAMPHACRCATARHERCSVSGRLRRLRRFRWLGRARVWLMHEARLDRQLVERVAVGPVEPRRTELEHATVAVAAGAAVNVGVDGVSARDALEASHALGLSRRSRAETDRG